MTPLAIKKTVSRLHLLREEIAVRQEEFKTLSTDLCDLGKGDYLGLNEEVVKVVEVKEGSPSYKLAPADLDTAKEIAGDSFGKVFDKKITFEPCSSFADVVAKLLPKNIAAKLLALVEKPGKAASSYLKYP